MTHYFRHLSLGLSDFSAGKIYTNLVPTLEFLGNCEEEMGNDRKFQCLTRHFQRALVLLRLIRVRHTAGGDHKKFSDIDILFEAANPLPLGFVAEMKMNLEESKLTLKVDLVDRKHLAESYAPKIEKEKVEVVPKRPHP